MRTRLDLTPQCVDAFSRALTDGGLRGHFSPVGDGRIEFCINDPGDAEVQQLMTNISFYLFRIHRIEVDAHEPITKCEPFEFVMTEDTGEVVRLPLCFTYLCNEHGRLAPALSVMLGGY